MIEITDNSQNLRLNETSRLLKIILINIDSRFH